MKERPTKESEEYRGYLERCLQDILKDGFRLPAIRKADGKTYRFQFTGHLHIMESLQGLWERNNKLGGYTIRAKIENRGLYLGTILMLIEEQILTGRDNNREIAKLQEWIEMEKPEHEMRKILAAIKSEVKTYLEEIDNGLLTDEKFREKMMELVKVSFDPKDQAAMTMHCDRIIMEEILKRKNCKYQHTHRELERRFKGIQAVE